MFNSSAPTTVAGRKATTAERTSSPSVAGFPTTKGWLRLEPTRNNQRVGVRMAEDYKFERWASSLVVDRPATLSLLR
jgi:hypothetical protein